MSRKFTQLGDVQESTAISYLNELNAKYPPDKIIADTPGNREARPDLIGKALRGRMILEVPVQQSPVPPGVLAKAEELKIKIRDIDGKVYNP